VSKPPNQPVVDWYWKEVAALDLKVTDCTGIYHTTKGILACYYVQTPDGGWTQAVAEEQISRIRAEMVRRGRTKK
jgi:hypothetical protein